MQNPIYTEVTSCRDCYKCVRSCPVKAIQIKEGHAMIIKDLCIYCGHCVHVCPNSAKKVREDKDRVKLAISSGRKVICSLAPSYASEFEGFEKELLKDAEEDARTVEFIKNYLPQDVKDKFTDEELYYFLDVIVDYYATSGVFFGII